MPPSTPQRPPPRAMSKLGGAPQVWQPRACRCWSALAVLAARLIDVARAWRTGQLQKSSWPETEFMVKESQVKELPKRHGRNGGRQPCGRRAAPSPLESTVLHGEISKRLALARNTEDRKHLQSTQSARPAHLTDQAPSTIERTARETHNTNQHSSRARFSTTTTHHHHPHPTGSSPDPLSQRSPLRSLGAINRRAGPHYTTDTTHLSGTRSATPLPPTWGGLEAPMPQSLR